MSAEEVLQKRKEELGEEFGTAIYWLDNAVTNAFVELKIFHGLFVHSRERVDVLNQASGLVVMYTSKAIWDSLCMALCRLTDPANTAGNKNLSLGSLNIFLKEKHKKPYQEKVIKAVESAEVFRRRRNKVLAHADAGIALELDVLEGCSFSDTKTALELIVLKNSRFTENR